MRAPVRRLLSADLFALLAEATGATVPGATIKVRNKDTNLTRDGSSGADGGFIIPNLTPGN